MPALIGIEKYEWVCIDYQSDAKNFRGNFHFLLYIYLNCLNAFKYDVAIGASTNKWRG